MRLKDNIYTSWIGRILKKDLVERTRLFSRLDSQKQASLSENEKIQYIVLKFSLEGKDSFLDDSYCTALLGDLMILWIESNRDIPPFFIYLFKMMHLDWLIDWKKSSEKVLVIRENIVSNLHTIINPFLEEIEEILEEPFKSRERRNIKDRIVNTILSLMGDERCEKLPFIYHALFKIKYALQGANEYLCTQRVSSIILNRQVYQLDLQSLTHIFLRHMHRFKTLSHRQNNGSRGFFDTFEGEEFNKIEEIIRSVNLTTSSNYTGESMSFEFDGIEYKVIIRGNRIVTIYPL